jgi:Tol biopolymer transport system component
LIRTIGLSLALLLIGCREAPDLFSADPFGAQPDSVVLQLTWNTGPDLAPAWSAQADSVFYSTTSFPGLGLNSGGVLLGVPRAGGSARLLLPAVQLGASQSRFLTAPALSADGRRVAFFELTLAELPRCDFFVCSSADTLLTQPLLRRGQLRVRTVDQAGPDDAVLDIVFQGRSFDPARGLPFGLTLLDDLPFQHRFTVSRQPTFRAAWSPDGTRIVLSDGLQLLLWQPGSSPAPIPNTQDGVWPAWSPDGQWIAYTRLPRGARQVLSCTCYINTPAGPSIVEIQERATYDDRLQDGTLTLIRPSGTDKRELGAGEAPAWLPDNSTLIVARQQALWRVRIDGTAASELPHTHLGHSPALTRDGRYLAFSRQQLGMDWNIWLLRLEP